MTLNHMTEDSLKFIFSFSVEPIVVIIVLLNNYIELLISILKLNYVTQRFLFLSKKKLIF